MTEVARGAVRTCKASPKPDLYGKEMGPRAFLGEGILIGIGQKKWLGGSSKPQSAL